ncbi:MAG: branched-chain amino acid transporter permease [Lachnospiraceae bacterium]
MTDLHAVLLIVMISGVTMLLRFLPFWVFGGRHELPGFVLYLGKVLPQAIMGMLVVYCLKDVAIREAPHGVPELLACVIVAVLHKWKKNTLLSIIVGTVFYMLLIRVM